MINHLISLLGVAGNHVNDNNEYIHQFATESELGISCQPLVKQDDCIPMGCNPATDGVT